jgi:hypothetical protein
MDQPSSFINSIKNPNENAQMGLKLLIVLIISFIALVPIFLLYMPNNSSGSVVSTTLITLFSLFLVALFGFAVFRMKPSSNGGSALKSVLSGNVIMLILYTIGLIFFFVLVPSSTMNKYAYLFLPITILISIVLFSLNIAENHNPLFYNSEKIKFSIISVCFIIIMILFYNKNPGGYIQKYFGGTLLLTILLAVFGLLYMMTLFFGKGSKQGQPGQSGFFGDLKSKSFTTLDIVSTVGFILFVLLITVGISIYPGGLFKQDTSTSATILTCVLITTIGLVMYFSKGLLGTTEGLAGGDGIKTINDIFRSALLLVFGLGFSGIMIAWLVNSLGNLSSTSGIVSFVLNLLIVVAILSLVFKLITGTPVYKIPGVKLLVNILFYIPCILVNLIDGGVWLFGKAKGMSSASAREKTDPTTMTHWILLAMIILLFLLYFMLPYIQKQVVKQGGNLLLNNPVSLTTQNTLGAYQTLNGSTNFDYQYAISFWFTLDAVGPNTSTSSNNFTSIMSYGGKPNVLYNASTNTLMITMMTKEPNQKLISEKHDENGDLILYERTDILLQKWNHLIVNYNGGNMDIFYNGELVKSVPGVVPYMEYDNLNIGYEKGVHGQICNLNYFKKNLTIQQVYYLYHLVKDKNPPVSYNSKETIIKMSSATAANIYGGTEVSLKKVGQEATTIATGDSVPNTIQNALNPFKKQDFLSLRWYFSANNDYVGSMT